jgi:hypothetical protein
MQDLPSRRDRGDHLDIITCVWSFICMSMLSSGIEQERAKSIVMGMMAVRSVSACGGPSC